MHWVPDATADADAVAANEIAEVRWASVDDAARVLTWERDVRLHESRAAPDV